MKFKRIKELALKFKNEMLLMDDVDLFIAELSYDNNFEITEKKNNRRIQVSSTTDNILWPKESLLNIAISHLTYLQFYHYLILLVVYQIIYLFFDRYYLELSLYIIYR